MELLLKALSYGGTAICAVIAHALLRSPLNTWFFNDFILFLRCDFEYNNETKFTAMGGRYFERGVAGEGALRRHGLMENDPIEISKVSLTDVGQRYAAHLRQREVKRLRRRLPQASWAFLLQHADKPGFDEESIDGSTSKGKRDLEAVIGLSDLWFHNSEHGPKWHPIVAVLREELLRQRDRSRIR